MNLGFPFPQGALPNQCESSIVLSNLLNRNEVVNKAMERFIGRKKRLRATKGPAQVPPN